MLKPLIVKKPAPPSFNAHDTNNLARILAWHAEIVAEWGKNHPDRVREWENKMASDQES